MGRGDPADQRIGHRINRKADPHQVLIGILGHQSRIGGPVKLDFFCLHQEAGGRGKRLFVDHRQGVAEGGAGIFRHLMQGGLRTVGGLDVVEGKAGKALKILCKVDLQGGEAAEAERICKIHHCPRRNPRGRGEEVDRHAGSGLRVPQDDVRNPFFGG